MSARPTGDDLACIAEAAIAAGLASPERRGLLLGHLDPQARASLAQLNPPSDQLRADLKALAGHVDGRLLDDWLLQAARIASQTHPVEAHLFSRYRVDRHALLVAGGTPPPDWAHSASNTAGRLLRRALGAGRGVGHIARFDGVESAFVLDLVEHYAEGPEVGLLWVHLAGELFDKRGIRLRTTDRAGLSLHELAKVVADARAAQRIVLIETRPDRTAPDLGALLALHWGDAALVAAGPDLTAALAEAFSAAGPRTGEALARALPTPIVARGTTQTIAERSTDGAPQPDDSDQTAIAEYLEGLRATCRSVPLGRRTTGLETLGEVYVPLYTSSPSDAEPMEDAKRRECQRVDIERAQAQPKTLHDRVAELHHIFVVGGPGSGKTTSLRRLCAMLCDAHLSRDNPDTPAWVPRAPLPVWVDLRNLPPDLPRTGDGLLDWAFGRLARAQNTDKLAPEVAREALRDGRLVLILDGLDEVPDSQHRRDWAEAITRLTRVQCAGARVWVSCREAARVAGAEPGAPLVRIDLRPFDTRQRGEVIAHWFRSRIADAAEARTKAEELIADLRNHPRVDTATASPLVLALVCLLYVDERRLPDSRVELYGRLIDLLLGNRGQPVDDRIRDLHVHQRRAALTDLALEWWTAPGNRSSSGTSGRAGSRGIGHDACVGIVDDTLARLRPDLRANDAERYRVAQALVDFFDQRTGLLRWTSTDANGQRQLGFAHRTFADYLVACRLGECADTREHYLCETHARDPDWRQAFVLFAAQTVKASGADSSTAWRWIERLAAWVRDETHPPAHRAAYARLAAECLQPCRDCSPPDPTVAAVDDLQELMLDAETCGRFPPAHRAAYWHAIGEANRLLGPRGPGRWVAIPAGDFWRGAAVEDELAADDEEAGAMIRLGAYHVQRWPVLVSEYARFVDDGGYGTAHADKPRWWTDDGWAWRIDERIDAPEDWLLQRQGRPTHPVIGVSWFEAMAYVRWLGESGGGPDGVAGTADLPTEDEWERAARGGGPASKRRRFPWGWDDDALRRNGMDTGLRRTNAVGAFPGGCSPDGVWAMSGNVWEWCRREPMAGSADATEQTEARDERTIRVMRGGGWGGVPQGLRVSYRFISGARERFAVVGFRCVWRPPVEPTVE